MDFAVWFIGFMVNLFVQEMLTLEIPRLSVLSVSEAATGGVL